jgi:glycosyltransferase involved in cell wall biosynthesis
VTSFVALSIIIPVRNRQYELNRLLADIDADVGTYRNVVEIVIVDDGSEPAVLLPQTLSIDPVLVRLPLRQGASAARAEGLRHSRGRAVHFHDSDDGLVPGWFEGVMRALETHPAAGVMVTRRLDEIGGRHLPAAQRYFERFAAAPLRIQRMLMLRNCLGPLGGVIFARRVLRGVGFPNQPSAQDWALYAEVYARWEPTGVAISDTRFVYRRDGLDRISASPRRKVLGFAAIARRARNRWYMSILRMHHLHQARGWVAACSRRDADRILRRTRLGRWSAYLLTLLYSVLVLGLR